MTSIERHRGTNATVNAILHYGYDPACDRAGLPAQVVEAAAAESIADGHDALVQAGIAAFRDAIDAELSGVESVGPHVVPVSGGLDSRAILAALVERPDVDRRDVHAVTFGSPGTWDYEIGQRVARTAGVHVTSIDLTADSFDWSVESIRAYAAERECPGGILDGYVNSVAADVAGEDAVVWSGFMGDPSAGGHQPAEPREEWAAARAHFADGERYAEGLTAPGFDPRSVLPAEPFVSRQCLSYEEQLDFACRQQCLVAPTVLESEDNRTPFMQPAWLAFSLNLPREYRRNRRLFVDVCTAAFPDLFALPTDANAGYPLEVGGTRRVLRRAVLLAIDRAASLLGVSYTHPDTNYLDFETAFRSGRLRPTGAALTKSLSERDVADWIDPREIWQDHLAGADWTEELLVLVALELFLAESLD